jgi:hypothetical protein
VHADGDAAGARVAVVPRQRSLPAFVEAAGFGQGEWMRGNHHPSKKLASKVRQMIRVRSGHR